MSNIDRSKLKDGQEVKLYLYSGVAIGTSGKMRDIYYDITDAPNDGESLLEKDAPKPKCRLYKTPWRAASASPGSIYEVIIEGESLFKPEARYFQEMWKNKQDVVRWQLNHRIAKIAYGIWRVING